MKIRNATKADAERIYEIMYTAHAAMADKSAYITDSLEFIKAHIDRDGFTIVTEEDDQIVAFLEVCVPGLAKNNLGYFLDLSDEELMQVALMDSSAVLPEYQGRGIMFEMFRLAVERAERDYPLLIGTVAPDNWPSRRNFEKLGFTCLRILDVHEGKTRCLMAKGESIDRFLSGDQL